MVGGGGELSRHICLPPIKMSAKAFNKGLLSRAPSNRYIFITETKGFVPLINICFSKCHGEMWDAAISQFVHTSELLVDTALGGCGQGAMGFHTLHWKGSDYMRRWVVGCQPS